MINDPQPIRVTAILLSGGIKGDIQAHMTCSERMRRDFHACVPHERLTNALELMGERGVDWVAVVQTEQERRFLGWITARDAAVFLAAFDRRPSEAMCRELLAAPPALLSPEEAWEEAEATLHRCRLRRLPVVQDGILVGIAEE